MLPSRFAAALAANAGTAALTVQVSQAQASAPQGAQRAAASSPSEHFPYVLLGTAGSGGMGTVHVAKDTELLRRVALKQIHADTARAPGGQARFLREVQITAQLGHPNIVPVYALELTPDGLPAYTMKYIEGRTFQSLLKETREFYAENRKPDEAHSLPTRLEHFLKVCDAVAYAHDKKVIHRDLKPANLMLGRYNEVYVMDWGLCRLVDQAEDVAPAEASRVAASPDASGSASETQSGDVVGTPKYMSPEQAQGRNQELDARSDKCALGLILFELVTLASPYAGSTAYEVMVNAAMGRRRPVVPAYKGMRVARELMAIIERATAPSPSDRYSDVAAFAADLRRYLRGEAVHASPDSPLQRVTRWAARHRQGVLTSVLATFALAAAAIGLLIWQNQRQLVVAHAHEQQLLRLRDAVSRVGDRVQTRFLQLEGFMENLADSTAQHLDVQVSGNEHYYLASEFRDPQRAPPDLTPSRLHAGRISLQWPVWSLPPGMSEAEGRRRIALVAAMQPFFRDIYRRGVVMTRRPGAAEPSAPAVVSDDASPLSAIAIAFDDGVTVRYPGWDGLTADYDGRARPWYKLGLDAPGPHWGAPYFSSISGRDELPLAFALIDGKQRRIGVAAAILSPQRMVSSLLEIDGIPGLRGVYLLDGDGHVLAESGMSFHPQDVAPDQPVTERFPLPSLVTAVQNGQSGTLETSLRGATVVVAYDVVDPLGWSVVAVADQDVLLGESAAKTERR